MATLKLKMTWRALWSSLVLVFACLMFAVAGAESDGLWSTDDVADYLGVPASTVRYWVWLGVGPKSMKIGRYRRFKPSDVQRWAESQTALPAPTPRAKSRLTSRKASPTSSRRRSPRTRK